MHVASIKLFLAQCKDPWGRDFFSPLRMAQSLELRLQGEGGRKEGTEVLIGVQSLNLTYWSKLLRIVRSLDMPIFKNIHSEPNLNDFRI